MTDDITDDPVVLIAEDDRDLADLFAQWLTDGFEVRTAYDGDQALGLMDDEVELVLLDRRMPGVSGDEFLDEIRNLGYDCQVAIVSAVDVDFDVLDMGFDEYIEKPVDREALLETVNRLLTRGLPDPDIREYFSLVSKRHALEAEMPREQLDSHEEYADLMDQAAELRTQILAVAEATLEDGADTLDPARKRVFEDAIASWEERKRSLEEADPLYSVADAKIETYRDRLPSSGGGPNSPRRKFLEMVAAGFTAEDFWLEPTVLRALNETLFGKFDDTLVINRRRITEDTTLDEDDLYEVSSTVRAFAQETLEGER